MVLLSGGMDSVTALYESRRTHDVVVALSFHYGSKHNDKELSLARWHAENLGLRHLVIPLAFIGEHFESDLLAKGADVPAGRYAEDTMKQTVVPFRNGIMLSVAAGLAESRGADAVVIAAHAGDHAIYPDCRPEFMTSMAEAIRLGTYAQVEVLRPFITKSKADIAGLGAALGVDYARTWSCYAGGETHCGECGTCIERREAFLLAGVPDPTTYLSTATFSQEPD